MWYTYSQYQKRRKICWAKRRGFSPMKICAEVLLRCLVYLVSPADRFFPFLFVVMEKTVWWISIGRFVLQTPRFWESLIGVDNYKGLFDKVSITIVTCNNVYIIKCQKLCQKNYRTTQLHGYFFANRSINLARDRLACVAHQSQLSVCVPTDLQLNWIDVLRKSCCVCHPDFILTNAQERIIGLSRFLQSASLASPVSDDVATSDNCY